MALSGPYSAASKPIGASLLGPASARYRVGEPRAATLVLPLLLSLLGVIWGLQIALSKLAGEEVGATVGGLLFIHLLLLGCFGLGLLLRRRLFVPRARELRFFTVSALLVNILPLWLELTVAPHLSAGLLTLIGALTPVFAVMAVVALRSEAVGWPRRLGVCVGFAAVAAVLYPQVLVADANLRWIAIAFALPLIGAVYAVYMARLWPGDRSPMQVTTGILLAGTLLLLAGQLLGGGISADGWPSLDIGPSLLALAVTIGAEFYLFSLLIRRGGVVFTSCADFVAVFAGLGWGFLLFAERPDGWVLLAVALGALALLLICIADGKRTHGANGIPRGRLGG